MMINSSHIGQVFLIFISSTTGSRIGNVLSVITFQLFFETATCWIE